MITSRANWFILFCLIYPSLCLAQHLSLHDLLRQNTHLFGEVLDHPSTFEIQILYTQINRDENNIPTFKTYRYNTNDQKYFYPASTVKLPTAILALEKINQLNIIGLNKETALRIDSARTPQTKVEKDSTSQSGNASIAHYIKKILVVSDNEAYNRLYEFLGQKNLNESLWKKGYTNCRILHRLGSEGGSFDDVDNRYTNPIAFYENEKLLYFQGECYSDLEPKLNLKKEQRGQGFYDRNDILIRRPFNFSKKNFIGLETLLDILKAIIFPETVPIKNRFNLTEEDYRFLYEYLSKKPRECTFPKYDLPDGYSKYFLYNGKENNTPNHIRIYNKIGFAYGFLTDVAFIVDFEKKVEFFLAATIHVNENLIYNDDNYQYDETGLPFLANLGKVIYNYETQRHKNHLPNLKKFKLH